MATPPTFVADYQPANWTATTTPKTVSATVSTGDVLVSVAGRENNNSHLATPTGGTSISWTLQENPGNTGNFGELRLCTAAPNGQTWTYSQSDGGGTAAEWGFDVLRFSGSLGVGAASSATGTTGGSSLSLTTTADNSAIVVVVTDWNSVDGSSRVWRTVNSITPTAGNGLERVYQRGAGVYTAYVAYWSDVGAAGAKTVGFSTPSSGVNWCIAAIEVKGTTSTNNTSTGGLAFPKMALAGTVVETETSAGGLAIPKMAMSGTANTKSVVSGGLALPTMAMSGTANTKSVASGGLALPKLGMSGEVGQESKTSGSLALPRMALSGTVTETETSSGSLALPKMAMSGTATVSQDATGGLALPKMALSGTVGQQSKASGSLALPRMALSGTTGQTYHISGSLALPRMAMHGSEERPPRVPLHLGGTVTEENELGGSLVRYSIDGTVTPASQVYSGTAIRDTPVYDGTASLFTIDGTVAIETIDGSLTQITNAGTLDEWTMTPINITLAEFNDEQLAVTVTQSSAPLDLTTATSVDAFFKTAAGVSDTDGSTIKLSSLTSGVTVTDAGAGDVMVDIPADDLANAGIGFWRLDVVDVDGNRNTAIYGTVTITLL